MALLVAWRSLRGAKVEPTKLRNPLQLRAAIEMAVLFQIVLFAVHYVRSSIGEGGLLASGFVLGLTDVDALTLSMTRSVSSGTTGRCRRRAITIGIVANSLMKAGIAVAVGSRPLQMASRGCAAGDGRSGCGRPGAAVIYLCFAKTVILPSFVNAITS